MVWVDSVASAWRCGVRRLPPEGSPRVSNAPDLEIDFEARRVRARGVETRLTSKEFELLRYLVAPPAGR
jgi:DNA-binding response OmpR family regulator